MELRQPTQPSISQQPPDDSSVPSRTRLPLTDAAGNAQIQALALVDLYHHDRKSIQPWGDMPMYIPIVPSQPPGQPLRNTLELRRQSIRRQKQCRFTFSRNPIAKSPQYIAYRDRQTREGNAEDQKWPEVLEDAFLNALIDIPIMGRRKFSMRGKLHGRNELIREYLWISYVQSLAPSQEPDETMHRTRKQISSHIQVLKGFMKDNPEFQRLFPKKKTLENGFEDSFKNSHVLRALQEGHIWNAESVYDPSSNSNKMDVQSHRSIRPDTFWLLVTSTSVPDRRGRYMSETDLHRDQVVAHQYTRLHSQTSREHLENLPHWRRRFPNLARIHSSNELNCEILHMDVSLELMRGHVLDGAELVTRMEMLIPGPDFGRHQWKIVTSLIKPQGPYYEGLDYNTPLDCRTFEAEVQDVTEADARIKVPFPANTWAHTFTCLTNLERIHDENRKTQSFSGAPLNGSTRSAREYVEQISMYQEVLSSSGEGMQFMRRAIILWTFRKAGHGKQGSTTWRYVDPLPSHRLYMSPSPHPSHNVSAAVTENFNSWADNPIDLQGFNVLDPFVQGLATPPNTAGLQSPFVNVYGYTDHHFDVHMGLISNATVGNESTVVENETTAKIDSFLSNAIVNLHDFDHNSNGWHLPHTESFDADPAWANYIVPAGTPQLGWENDAKNHVWLEMLPTKQVNWIDDANGKPDEQWNDAITRPTKQDQGYIEATIGQKLLPLIDNHSGVNGEAAKKGFLEAHGTLLPEMSNGNMSNETRTKKQKQI